MGLLDPNVETLLSMWTMDGDFESLYPNIMKAFNSSRMTLSSVVFNIQGKSQLEVYNYYACLIHQYENAIYLGKEFHGFPSYQEMYEHITSMESK